MNKYEKTELKKTEKNTEPIIKNEDAEEIRTTIKGMWGHIVNDLLREKRLLLEVDDTTLNPKKLHRGIFSFFDIEEINKMSPETREDLKDSMTIMLL